MNHENVPVYMTVNPELEAQRAWQMSRIFNPHSIELLKELDLPRSEWALDLGCGPGTMFEHLLPYTDHLVGVDPIGGILKAAQTEIDTKGLGSKVKLIEGTIFSDKIPDNTFGLIYMRAVAQHIRREIHEDTMKKIADKLKTGGRLIIEDIVLDSWRIDPHHPAFGHLKAALKLQRYGDNCYPDVGLNLMSLANKANLEVVNIEPFGWYQDESKGPGKMAHIGILTAVRDRIIGDKILSQELFDDLLQQFQNHLMLESTRAFAPGVGQMVAIKR